MSELECQSFSQEWEKEPIIIHYQISVYFRYMGGQLSRWLETIMESLYDFYTTTSCFTGTFNINIVLPSVYLELTDFNSKK